MLVGRTNRRLGLALTLLLLPVPAAKAAEPDGHDFGPAGVLTLRSMPPCVVKDFPSAYDRCLESRPPMDAPAAVRAKALVSRAIVLIYLRRWPEARQELDDAIAADPTFVEARHLAARLAITAYMEGHDPSLLAAAQLHTSAAVKLAPRNADVRATGAFFVHVRGQDDDAIRAYSAAIALQPAHAFALGQRAMLHAAQGRLPQALKDFDAAIAAAPKDLYLRRGRAQLLIVLERPREALADVNFVIEQMPNDFLAYSARAGIHRQLGNFESAVEDLTTLILGSEGRYALRDGRRPAGGLPDAARHGAGRPAAQPGGCRRHAPGCGVGRSTEDLAYSDLFEAAGLCSATNRWHAIGRAEYRYRGMLRGLQMSRRIDTGHLMASQQMATRTTSSAGS